MRDVLVHLRLRGRLVLTVVAAASLATALAIYLAVTFFERKMTESAERSAEEDGNELRAVIEEEMMAPERATIQALVDQVGRASGVRWVGILDAHGTVQMSSEPPGPPGSVVRFAEGSEERQWLRLWEEARAASARAHVSPGCNVLRVMVPIGNDQRCWRCHGEHHAVNGMIIIDRSLAPLQAVVASGARRLALGGVATLVLILGALGLVVERNVLTRLGRLRGAARRLGSGDLAARAEDDARDELGDVAREFNAMAARLEEAILGLAGHRQQLEELVNGIADGIVLLDLESRVVTMNRAFAARLQGERPPPGAPYRELLRAARVDAQEGDLPAERALASGRLEKGVVAAGGGERFEELYAQPLLGPDGRAAAVIEVWRDVTERRALEATVEQSERLASMGVLASAVAHEVGNPLASIITAVDGLLGRVAAGAASSPEETRQYLEIVRSQVFRCQGVTERLLGFARVPTGEVAAVNVAAAVREVLALVGPQARAQGVEWELRGPDPLLAAAPDMLLQQVFLNLVLNALKVMPQGGRLRVELGRDGERVTVAVSDTGPGIPDAVRRHLFEPFRRGRRDRGGTGLGLFISHALVARAGGSIEVESRPGEGARFVVRLRVALGAPAPQLPRAMGAQA